MKKYILLFAGVLGFCKTQAQFQQSYGRTLYETGQSVQQTTDKGYIIAGYTREGWFGNGEATLIKTDQNGNPLWVNAYGGEKTDFFNSVRQVDLFSTSRGVLKAPDYVATGYTQSFGFGNNDVYLVGTDGTGMPFFSKTFGGAASDIGHCIQVVNDNQYGYGYVIVGETNSFPNLYPGSNVYVIRTDLVGNLITSVVIGTYGNDQGFWIEQTRDGGYIIAGSTTASCGFSSSVAAPRDIYAIRLKPDLSVAWNRIIGGGNYGDDVAYSVKETRDGSFIFSGTSRSFGVGTSGDAFLLNLDAAGNFLWMKTYGNKSPEEGRSVLETQTRVGGYVVSGYRYVNSVLNPHYEARLFQTDASGNLLWTRDYGSYRDEFAFELDHSSAPGYVFTGRESSFGAGGGDAYLVTTDLNGKSGSGCERTILQNEIKVEPCITSNAQYVRVKPELDVQSKYLEIKYKVSKCPSIGPAEELAQDVTGNVDQSTPANERISISPNPATTSLTLIVNDNSVGGVMKIFDYQGKVILQKQIEGNNSNIAVENFPNGIYFLNVFGIDGEIISLKFIKQQ